jgi:hypothetical protein
MTVTFGDGAGEGEGDGEATAVDVAGVAVDAAAGVAVIWGLGCCALARHAHVANIPDPRRNARQSEFVVLLFIGFSTFGMMRRYVTVKRLLF